MSYNFLISSRRRKTRIIFLSSLSFRRRRGFKFMARKRHCQKTNFSSLTTKKDSSLKISEWVRWEVNDERLRKRRSNSKISSFSSIKDKKNLLNEYFLELLFFSNTISILSLDKSSRSIINSFINMYILLFPQTRNKKTDRRKRRARHIKTTEI